MKSRAASVAIVVAIGAVAVVIGAAFGSWAASGGEEEPAAVASAEEPESKPVCAQSERASWQKLANEIQAPVYCPSWLPEPLVGRFSGRFFNGRSVDPDRSYLVSFVWFETGQGIVNEVHVNLRGYPGSTRIPPCEDTLTVAGKTVRKQIPCFSDRHGTKRVGGVTVDRVHGQPGRRPVARPLRLAPKRLAVHALGARRGAVQRRARSSPTSTG